MTAKKAGHAIQSPTHVRILTDTVPMKPTVVRERPATWKHSSVSRSRASVKTLRTVQPVSLVTTGPTPANLLMGSVKILQTAALANLVILSLTCVSPLMDFVKILWIVLPAKLVILTLTLANRLMVSAKIPQIALLVSLATLDPTLVSPLTATAPMTWTVTKPRTAT